MNGVFKGGKPLIVFDIGNVLLKFDFFRAAANFDKVDPGSGERLRKLLWFSSLNGRLETGRLSGLRIYRLLKKTAGLSMSYAQFCAAFNDIFEPITENIRLLRHLSSRFPTALLSNTNGIHWRYMLRKYPALRRARWPYSSHILGYMKPDRRIYRELSRRTRVPLERMIFFDDRLENIVAARRLGMTAVHYKDGRLLHRELRKLGVLNGGFRG